MQNSFSGVKQPERELKDSPMSRARVENVYSYEFAFPICSHGVYRHVLNLSVFYRANGHFMDPVLCL
jgi:hypothetical protein